MDERGGEMEKEVAQPYYEDDYQSLDEVDTADLLEMKEGALNDLNENAHHYDNPTTCVRSAHDNRELKDIVHLLILAGGNEIPSNHYGVLRDA